MKTKKIYTVARYTDTDYGYTLVPEGDVWYEDKDECQAEVDKANASILIRIQAKWKREYEAHKSCHADAVALFLAGRRADPGPFNFTRERPLSLALNDEGYTLWDEELKLKESG